MAEVLSSREVYELIIGGGVRGSRGTKIEGTRFYWNSEYGQYDPQDEPIPLFSVSASDFLATGTNRTNILGSPQFPYYTAPEGIVLPEISDTPIKSLCYAIRCVEAPPSSPDLYSSYLIECLYLDELGNIVGINNVDCKYILEDSGADIVNACYGGLLREGDFSCGLIGLCRGGESATREFYTSNETIGSGNDAEYYISYWGAGQKPIEDDGVVPTGGSGGGGGAYSRTDESVPVPSLPQYSVCDIGTTALYEMSPAGLHDFSNFLWSSNFFDNILKNRQSPLENIIQITMVPRLEFTGVAGTVVIGNVNSPASGLKLSTSFYQINCGTINVTEYYRNYADYHTEISIYLPYCGIYQLDVNDCMNGIIQVMYNIDVFSGECVAFVSCNTNGVWHVLGTYNGNVASQFPLADRNMASYYSSLLGAVGSALNKDIIGGATQIMNAKPTFSRAGSIGGVAGMLNIKYPYLIFTTPQIFTAETFRQNKGYMSNLSGKVSSFSGYVSCDPDKLDLTGLVLMEEEREMLHSILSEGFYV